MNFFKLLALICLMITMFVQDVIAKTSKKSLSSKVKETAKKGAKTLAKKAVKTLVEDDEDD